MLGAAGLGGLGYSLATDRVPWRAEVVREQQAGGRGGAGERSKADDATANPAAASITVLIDINTADAKELELLPGIGPAMAERIVEDRARVGAFRRLEDLGRVKGIGVKTIERLRGKATVGEVGGVGEPPAK